MIPGTHIAVVSNNLSDAISGRLQGWELRDTLLILMPGPTNLFIYLFRVPLEEKTIAAQVLKTGTGGLNIDACRVSTSQSDAKAMERCNTPGSHRMHPSISPIGTFTRSNSSGELDTTKGRWPSNLLLIHHPECKRVGEKLVKSHNPDNNKISPTTVVVYGVYQSRSFVGHAKDGLETISAWSCHPSCPVKLLDEQSGERPSGKSNAEATVGEVTPSSITPLRRGTLVSRYDSGGASRFYPQFKNLAECFDWIDQLIN